VQRPSECQQSTHWDADGRVVAAAQGCVFTQDINQAIYISDAMETGTVQVNAAPARGPDVSVNGAGRSLLQLTVYSSSSRNTGCYTV
jgi:acyl-CoA reductase-like NAD-dependent aldehyde dehydrogenase